MLNNSNDSYLKNMLSRNNTSNNNNNISNNEIVEGLNYENLKEVVKKRIHEIYKTRILEDKSDEFKNLLFNSIVDIIDADKKNLEITQVKILAKKMLDFIWGLGPLEKLLEDEEITEIMVTRYDKIYVEKRGKLQLLSNIRFDKEEDLRIIIDKIVQPIGRTIDESKPIVDARLSDGSRVHAVIPPICPDGSLLTIRKFSKKKLTGEDYIKKGSLNAKEVDFLRRAVISKLNIIVSGGTGTGKTTLLNMLSNFVPSNESLITVEDSCELILGQDNVRRLEARPANAEGNGAITIRDCVKATLRMRPDRIIVGEIRDGVIVDLFRALSSGHDGGLSTIHANSPEDLVSSVMPILFGMSDMSFTEDARNKLIASALDLIVQITRFSDGSRKITKITHVVGIGKKQGRLAGLSEMELSELENNEIILKDIFIFKQTGKGAKNEILGDFLTTGYIPLKLLEKFELDGNPLPGGKDFFKIDSNEDMDILSKMVDTKGVTQEQLMKTAEVVKYNSEEIIPIPDLSPNDSTNDNIIPIPDLSPSISINDNTMIIPDLLPDKDKYQVENFNIKNDNNDNSLYNDEYIFEGTEEDIETKPLNLDNLLSQKEDNITNTNTTNNSNNSNSKNNNVNNGNTKNTKTIYEFE